MKLTDNYGRLRILFVASRYRIKATGFLVSGLNISVFITVQNHVHPFLRKYIDSVDIVLFSTWISLLGQFRFAGLFICFSTSSVANTNQPRTNKSYTTALVRLNSTWQVAGKGYLPEKSRI